MKKKTVFHEDFSSLFKTGNDFPDLDKISDDPLLSETEKIDGLLKLGNYSILKFLAFCVAVFFYILYIYFK